VSVGLSELGNMPPGFRLSWSVAHSRAILLLTISAKECENLSIFDEVMTKNSVFYFLTHGVGPILAFITMKLDVT